MRNFVRHPYTLLLGARFFSMKADFYTLVSRGHFSFAVQVLLARSGEMYTATSREKSLIPIFAMVLAGARMS